MGNLPKFSLYLQLALYWSTFCFNSNGAKWDDSLSIYMLTWGWFMPFVYKGLATFCFTTCVMQFPRMLENDAIARYYALEKGQVVKVSYSGTFTDSLVTYRCVTWALPSYVTSGMIGNMYLVRVLYTLWNRKVTFLVGIVHGVIPADLHSFANLSYCEPCQYYEREWYRNLDV